MDLDYGDYGDYTAQNETEDNSSLLRPLTFNEPQLSLDHFLVAFNILISALGIAGNSLVVWVCGYKMKRTVLTTWYTSLAISNLLFCVFLPFYVFYTITSNWPFGVALCKLTSSVLFLNMYSSVFLLVLISADRCVLVLFPVWAHNHRTVQKASGVVVLVWLLSALLTVPSLIYRQVTVHGSVTQCYTNYGIHSRHTAVVLSRFVFGFLIPFPVIILCCVVLGLKMRGLTVRLKKPYKIMVALILSFFCCWMPYHAFVLLELNYEKHNLEILKTGLKVGSTLASANSFISPILYVFIGNDFKQTLKKSLTSKIEEAMAEDLRTVALNNSRSKSMDIIRC
ncbi:Chemokine-like receptor 1 [Oryzias melastigma]|uniref:Chemokine-like receptor 1 n=1 Tax=Oryzias melastigma TaxID=30732 RepID=A0A3B3B8K8_ORYME|nr:chemokine-like receptor 1 [Oryzias melastigma]KAF6733302.1 Chemokine-like receptor 1 [Oryzias melastigma]